MAALYREKKQNDLAAKQFDQIGKVLGANPPYDVQSRATAKTDLTKLSAGYKSVGKDQEAAKVQQDITKLNAEILEDQRKAAVTAPPVKGSLPPTISLGPGEKKTITPEPIKKK